MGITEPARVGFLTDSHLYSWQARAIERLQRDLDIEIPLVVSKSRDTDRDDEPRTTKKLVGLDDVKRICNSAWREKAWALVLAERTVAELLGDDRQLWRRVDVESIECFDGAEHVRCDPQTENGWTEFPEDVVTKVSERCDVAVRFGFGLIRGDILTAPEYGVLSFHPSDIRSYRGMGPPPIFYDERTTAGATLQRLNETIDGGQIVAYDEVYVGDCYTLWDVFDRIARLQISLLADGIDNLHDPSFEPKTVPDEELGDYHALSRRRELEFSGRIVMKNLSGRIRRRVRKTVEDGADGAFGGRYAE
ncbi:formyltransferase family protein [Halosolutus gelatinilyticus]|uniref:formyltransferase family protein n=1 Tax=Halosolutus gelatinilyticus TaxID=2931975 RepID=UPI001FF58803|nr:formyltransferase family protein [Halosolutus gelatinilyticus]